MGNVFNSTPFGSLFSFVPEDQRLPYVKLALGLSPSLKDMVFSAKTGAFVRGLSKQFFNLDDNAPKISWTIFHVAIGEKTLAQLPSLLSTTLQLANDKAQQMATEIEKELFVPIMLEFNQYLAQKKQAPSSPITTSPQASGARNVLDLKNQPRPPMPPAMPRR